MLVLKLVRHLTYEKIICMNRAKSRTYHFFKGAEKPDWPTRLYRTPILLNADLPDTQSTYTGSETYAHTGRKMMVGKDCPEKPAGNKLTNTAKKFTYRLKSTDSDWLRNIKKQPKLGEFEKCPFQAEKPLSTN